MSKRIGLPIRRRGHASRAASVIILATVGAATANAAQVRYTVTDIGVLGGQSTSEAWGLDKWGNVAAESAHAAVFSAGTLHDLGTFGGGWSSAHAINASGMIVGAAQMAGGLTHAFRFNGSMSDLGVLPGSGFDSSQAVAVNANGAIVGYSYRSLTPSYKHATLWQGGTMTDLNSSFGGNFSSATDVNATGAIVGITTDGSGTSHGIVLSSGTRVDLNSMYFNHPTYPNAINDVGQVAGAMWTLSGRNHAFIFDGLGAPRDLGTLGGSESAAFDINSAGVVVGFSYISPVSDTAGYHAFLYDNGVMTDLNSLISPSSGWELDKALGINDSGVIVGVGKSPSGTQHGYILTPVNLPDPASGSLLMMGCGLLCRRRM